MGLYPGCKDPEEVSLGSCPGARTHNRESYAYTGQVFKGLCNTPKSKSRTRLEREWDSLQSCSRAASPLGKTPEREVCGQGREPRSPVGLGRGTWALKRRLQSTHSAGTWCPHGRAAWTRHSLRVKRAPCSLQGLGAALRPFSDSSSRLPARDVSLSLSECLAPSQQLHVDHLPSSGPGANSTGASASRGVGVW